MTRLGFMWIPKVIIRKQYIFFKYFKASFLLCKNFELSYVHKKFHKYICFFSIECVCSVILDKQKMSNNKTSYGFGGHSPSKLRQWHQQLHMLKFLFKKMTTIRQQMIFLKEIKRKMRRGLEIACFFICLHFQVRTYFWLL